MSQNDFLEHIENNMLDQTYWEPKIISGEIDTHAQDEFVFRLSCHEGHLQVAQWLYSLDNTIDIHASNEWAFRWSCQFGRLQVAQWLCEIEPVYQITVENDKIVDYKIIELADYDDGVDNIVDDNFVVVI